MIIEIDNIKVLLIRKPIKNMYLRIEPTGLVKVSAPVKMPINIIESHIKSKQTWIIHTLNRVNQRNVSTMEEGQHHWYLGTSYPLIIHTDLSFKGILIQDNFMHGYFTSQNEESRKKQLNLWYKEQMKNLLPAMIKKWELIIGVSVHDWGIKIMKTRWGSCNVVVKRIWLNLNLIKKPIHCIEYVLVHEMVHLIEANHSKRFYALMSQFMPLWPEYQKQLEG